MRAVPANVLGRGWRWVDTAPLLAAVVLTGVWISWLLTLFIRNPDYTIHNDFARQLARGELVTPHFLYHGLTIGVKTLLPFVNYRTAGYLVCVAAYLVTSVAVYYWLRPSFQPMTRVNSVGLVVCTLLTAVIAPISLSTTLEMLILPGSGRYLFNYLELNTLHNPTQIVARPFPVLILLYLRQVYTQWQPVSQQGVSRQGRIIALGILLVVIGLSAKPSYFICMLPALVVMSGWRLLCQQPVNVWVTLLGMIMPSGMVLVAQYAFTYTAAASTDGEVSRVIFAPFQVVQIYEPHIPLTLLRLGLSVVFPWVVYGLHFQAARRDVWLNFAWLTVIFGVAYFYLFAESGRRFQDANFAWGANLSSVVLFVVSIGFWWRQRGLSQAKFWQGGVILGLHIISGLVYLVYYSSLQPR